MKTIVVKFGGTSVSSPKSVDTICSIVDNLLLEKKCPVVVVSAISSVTNLLLSLPTTSSLHKTLVEIRSLHEKLTKKIFSQSDALEILNFIDDQLKQVEYIAKKKKHTKKSLDTLASFGEIMSSYIITKALQIRKMKAKQVIATKLIITDAHFGSAEFLPEQTKLRVKKVITPLIKKNIVPVITGFIGMTEKSEITTLGRGGSDYSASVIGFYLSASEIQIWTDVDGVFTADPHIVRKAKLLNTISYKEASEMAWFGAKILHPRTIRPAISANIPVRVLNTFNPKAPGTLIEKKPKRSDSIVAISSKRKITLVNIYSTAMLLSKGFLVRIFDVFSKNNISIDLVSVSEVSVSVTLDNNEKLENVVKELSLFTTVSVKNDLGIVSIIGEGIITSTKTIDTIFSVLNKAKILVKMVSLGATDINISLVIDSDKIEKATQMLHNRLLFRKVV